MIDKVIIVYACDEKFLMQTYVSMYSVLDARKRNYSLIFYVLVPRGTRTFEYGEKWGFANFAIRYIEIDDKLFETEEMKITYITKATYYRLLVPMLFSDVDKCIYLDGDTICCSDIIELYEEDLGNYYIGGCRSVSIDWGEDVSNAIAERLDISSGDDYINAGVLLMNPMELKKLQDVLLIESTKGYLVQDQDVINKCCYGKIKILHMKYNVYSMAYNLWKKNKVIRYTEGVVKSALDAPCIVHFANEYAKPWRNDKCILYEKWWGIAERALPRKKFLELKNEEYKNVEKFSDKRLFERIERAENIIIFGFSKIGFEFESIICKKYGNEKIKCFCDNDVEKWGKEKDGYNVCRPEELINLRDGCFVVIVSQRYWKVIEEQLVDMGVNSDYIGIYRKKNEGYYLCLDERWLE
jgi:lipopolysaccharide biosynthesis glycosyltransferase